MSLEEHFKRYGANYKKFLDGVIVTLNGIH